MGADASISRNWLKAGTLFCVWVALQIGSTTTVADSVTETTRFKAAITTIILRSTEWPAEAFDDPEAPLILALVDAPPNVVGIFEQAFADLPVDGRTVIVRSIDKPGDAAGLHAVYFHSVNEIAAKDLLRHLQNRPVLTLGDADEFCDLGGIVNYRLVGAKMRYQFNRAAMEQAGIRVSAQVIRLAVEPPQKGGTP